MIEREYRVWIEYDNNGVWKVDLRKCNAGIETASVYVDTFESRSARAAVRKAAEWIKTDLEFAKHP